MNKKVIQYPFDTTKCQKIYNLIKKTVDSKIIDLEDKHKNGFTIVLGIKSIPDVGIVYYKHCNEHYELWEEMKRFLSNEFPDFLWNQIYIHVNFSSYKHKDIHVNGKVLVVAFGDFEGGELVIEGVKYVTKDKATFFNGKELEHWNEPITKGLKISVCCITDGRCPIYNE